MRLELNTPRKRHHEHDVHKSCSVDPDDDICFPHQFQLPVKRLPFKEVLLQTDQRAAGVVDGLQHVALVHDLPRLSSPRHEHHLQQSGLCDVTRDVVVPVDHALHEQRLFHAAKQVGNGRGDADEQLHRHSSASLQRASPRRSACRASCVEKG